MLEQVKCWINNIGVSVTKTAIYEYRDIWAEEGAGLSNGSAQWSFGNGSVGFIGLPIDSGWEVEAMYYHADTYPATATVRIDLMNYGNVASNAAGNTIASISLSSSTDGGGTTNNAYKYQKYATPIPINTTGSSTVIGFITRSEVGNVTDSRIGARLRRKVGDFVSDVEITK